MTIARVKNKKKETTYKQKALLNSENQNISIPVDGFTSVEIIPGFTTTTQNGYQSQRQLFFLLIHLFFLFCKATQSQFIANLHVCKEKAVSLW